jgi:hypothetical protein
MGLFCIRTFLTGREQGRNGWPFETLPRDPGAIVALFKAESIAARQLAAEPWDE